MRVIGYLIFLSLFLRISAWATINPLQMEITGASNVVFPTINQNNGNGTSTITENIKIYAGIMGPVCSSAEATCNNCNSTNLPCNTKRIDPNKYLTIKFRTDKADVISGSSRIFLYHTNKNLKINPVSQPPVFNVNTDMTVQFLWSTICSNIDAGSDCSTYSTDSSLSFGISTSDDTSLEDSVTFSMYVMGYPDTHASYSEIQYVSPCPINQDAKSKQGFCYLEIKRGDEKVYVSNYAHPTSEASTTFPVADAGGKFQILRIYYAPDKAPNSGLSDGDDGKFSTLVNSGSDFQDLGFTLNGNNEAVLADNKITGLSNGVRYYFRFANVDEAGNVYNFAGDNSLTGAQAGFNQLRADIHSAVPAEVTGILDGSDCFIATAAFGSSTAPQLDILRSFRNQFLLSNTLGRWFVKKYYKYSPKWAQKIKRKESAKAFVRATLSPVIQVAQWLILYGLPSFITLSLFGFFAGFFIVRRFIQNHD